MKKHFFRAASGLVAGAVLLMCSVPAMAHGNVDWSISIGAPVYYASPAPVYYSPPVVYSRPSAVYVQPQPVYEVVEPRVQYRQQPYYVYEPFWQDRRRFENERHGHHRHHHRDD